MSMQPHLSDIGGNHRFLNLQDCQMILIISELYHTNQGPLNGFLISSLNGPLIFLIGLDGPQNYIISHQFTSKFLFKMVYIVSC